MLLRLEPISELERYSKLFDVEDLYSLPHELADDFRTLLCITQPSETS